MKTQNPLSIVMHCFGMPFNGDTLKTESLGGTETAALQAAEMFAKYGHKVTMLCNTNKPGNYNNVEYRNIREFHKYFVEEQHDISLILRHPQLFSVPHNSKVNILWQHDLAFINDKKTFLDSAWNIDSVWCQSPFHKKQYKSVMGLPDIFYWVAGSAIDPTLLPNKPIERDRKKLIYASRPERGLESLVTKIMPKLLQYDSELKLYVTTYDTPGLQEVMEKIKDKAEPIKDSIVWLPPLTKKELYEQYSSAYLYLYPVTDYDKSIGHFEETYCLTIDECMSCGLPFVSRPLGAIPDTLDKDAGELVKGVDDYWCDRYADQVIRILKDDNIHFKMSQKGKEVALKEDTWEVRVQGFLNKIDNLLQINKTQLTTSENEKIEYIEAPMKLSVCILKRIQDANNINRCLSSVKRIAGENLDVTIRIQSDFDETEEYKFWNYLLDDSNSADWILWLYGSEELQNPQNIAKYLRNNPYEGYSIEKKKYVLDDDLNDGLFDNMVDSPPRLFRTDKDIVFEGKVFPRPVNKYGGDLKLNVNYFRKVLNDVSIIDFTESTNILEYFDKTHPVVENGGLVLNKDFHLMKGYMVLALNSIGSNHNKVLLNCEKVIELYHKGFIGDVSRMGREALGMYSKANELMETGFVMDFSFGVCRNGDPSEKSIMNIRLNTLSDAKKIIQPLMKNKINTIMDKYYLVGR